MFPSFRGLAVNNGQFTQLYRSLIAKGSLRPDPRQLAVVDLFQSLGDKLEGSTNAKTKGLYLVGGCGTGKTMLMDLFFENLEIRKKKRVHFHQYMIDVHARLFKLKNTKGTSASLIDRVAEELIEEASVLCFDEFQVTFIADAVIIRSLFTTMLQRGVVMIATSNRVPEDLYIGGLNRDLFTPFIPVLKNHCLVHNMDSATDYRQLAHEDEGQILSSSSSLESVFFHLAQNQVQPSSISVQGREVHVRRVAKGSAIGWFSFDELCNRPVGSADYIAIAKTFHTVFIDNVPIMTLDDRDKLRRFISLIDSLYDGKTRIFFSTSAKNPTLLFTVDQETKSFIDEVFAWDRTLSRITEMVSQEYQISHLRRLSVDDFYGQFDLENLTPHELHTIFLRYDKNNDSVIAVSGLNRMVNEIAMYLGKDPKVVSSLLLEALTDEHRTRIHFDTFETWVEKNGLLAL